MIEYKEPEDKNRRKYIRLERKRRGFRYPPPKEDNQTSGYYEGRFINGTVRNPINLDIIDSKTI